MNDEFVAPPLKHCTSAISNIELILTKVNSIWIPGNKSGT